MDSIFRAIGGLKGRIMPTDSKKIGFYLILQNFYSVFIATFDIALIYRATNSFYSIIFFYYLMYITCSVTFILFSVLFKMKSPGNLFRIAIMFQIILALFGIVFFKHLTGLLFVSGYFVIRGLYEGSIWLGRHSSIIIGINDKKRNSFVLKLQIFNLVVSALAPAVSGAVISFAGSFIKLNGGGIPSGYFYVFLVSLVLSLLFMIFSPSITFDRGNVISWSNIRRLYCGRKYSAYKYYTISNLLQNGTLVLCAAVINFLILKTEFNLGIFTSAVSVGAAFFYYFIRRRIKNTDKDLRGKFIAFGSGGEVVSRLVYFATFSLPGLISKTFVDIFVVPFKTLFSDNIVKKFIDRIETEDGFNVFEILVFQESLVLVTRVFVLLVFMGLLALNFTAPLRIFQWALAATTVFCLTDYLLLKRLR